MKKFLVPIFVLILIPHIFADSGINSRLSIEFRADYGKVSLSNFNENYSNVFNYGFTNMNATGSEINTIPYSGADIKYFLTQSLAIYLKADYLNYENSDIVKDPVTGSEIADSHVVFNLLYTGLGARYYFGSGRIFPYLSIDAGVFTHMDSFWEVMTDTSFTEYVPPGDSYQYINFSGSFFGANAEIGLEWKLFDFMGIEIGGGYRYGADKVSYVPQGIFTSPLFNLTTLDFSGLYGTGALVLYFGSAAESGAQAAAGDTGLGKKYEQWADYYSGQKNYQKALQYYLYAFKLTNDTAICKKIAVAYYYAGDKQNAITYLEKYTQQNQSDDKMKKWLDALQSKSNTK